jgi:hypothetical protein
LARAAPVPVFAAVGTNARDRVEDLFLAGAIERVASPRHAAVLLLAGPLRPADEEPLQRLHDQLPHPRATICWGEAPFATFAGAHGVPRTADPLPALLNIYRELLDGRRPSEPDFRPDRPPAPWRGIGEHGQGGKGMMGGTPYGRPMAMTDVDLRDGLALDAFRLVAGPFLPGLPAGLVLDLTLQGDVIQQACIVHPPFPVATASADAGFARARRLRAIARLLALLDLRAHATSGLWLAREAERGAQPSTTAWQHAVHASGAVQAIPPGLGCHDGLDARARLVRWLAAVGRDTSAAETAGGGIFAVPGATLAPMLRGLEWHEATLLLASFDACSADDVHEPAAPREHAA